MKRRLIVPVISTVLYAQSAPPLVVHRQKPPKQADLTAALAALQADGAHPGYHPVAVDPHPVAHAMTATPKGWKPELVPLDDGTRKALSISRAYLDHPSIATEGDDGRLRYLYGSGLATIVTAPLHLSTIELELGERLNAKPLMSDPIHWDIGQLAVGHGDSQQTLIFLRPRIDGLDDNLVLTTDRRSYYLRVVSTTHDYMARVAFDFPDASPVAGPATLGADSWATYQQQSMTLIDRVLPAADSLVITKGYRVNGKRLFWRGEQHPAFWPTDVYDDGKSVYITVPEMVTRQRAPALMRVGSNGLEPTNYQIDGPGHRYIVRSLFDQAALVDGKGRKQKIVYITRPEVR